MAKNKAKGKPRTATGVQNSTSSAPPQPASKTAKGDVDCHVNLPSANIKITAPMQTPVEPVAAPVVQIPPAESTTETWADPIADNSSYGTADSDDDPSAVSTPSAAAPSVETMLKGVAQAQETPLYVPEPSAEIPSTPSTSTAAQTPPAAVPADTAVPVHPAMSPKQPAGLATDALPSSNATVPQVAQVPHAAPAAAAAALKTPADDSTDCFVAHSSTVATKGSTGAACGLTGVLSWLLAAYTYPMYLMSGAAVGAVTAVRDAMPHTHAR